MLKFLIQLAVVRSFRSRRVRAEEKADRFEVFDDGSKCFGLEFAALAQRLKRSKG